ncbi:hypothetical protein [Halobaculum sp. MBLA0143]|uniref:hypothetical protein n=1 Tax=Halobaculum sp. MBLA0143 TaxID=3079933 RepID=UPI003523CA8A
MKRRALLSAVAAGGLAGCLSVRKPPTVVGLNQPVDVQTCGEVIRRPCAQVNSMERPVDRELQVQIQSAGGATAYLEDGRLVVRGYIPGSGDQNCRAKCVWTIELTDGVLWVLVRNSESPLPPGCIEYSKEINYRVAIGPEDTERVERVWIVHYSTEGEEMMSDIIYPPESQRG